ncbi:monovalent cation/H(+) antiporter subunit G [Microcella alkaliphila]|jgi:multicomponent Na+:H+ antiporter subunit G|nr:monovalent cation/H(+) antiporter subunit G [Microcella alkaliphila]
MMIEVLTQGVIGTADTEPFDDLLDLVAAVLLGLGAFLSLAAAIGLLRFPDALARLHAATKPQILGLIAIVLAIAVSARSWQVLLLLIPVVVLQMLTAPIVAHMVGRAGYRTGTFDPGTLVDDELSADLERAQRAFPEPAPELGGRRLPSRDDQVSSRRDDEGRGSL